MSCLTLWLPLTQKAEFANSVDLDKVAHNDGWLLVLGLVAFRDSISVYIGPSPREREKEEKG